MSTITWKGGIIAFLLILVWGSISFAAENPTAAVADVVEAMQSYFLGVKQDGNLETFPDRMLQGDIFDHAFAMSEKNQLQSTLEALETVYAYLGDRCDSNLSMAQLSTVFAETAPGKIYETWMYTRQKGAPVDERSFDDACRAVYSCYFAPTNDALKNADQQINYNTDVINGCLAIVTNLYTSFEKRAHAEQTLNSTNYGDELLSNANNEDGPFDLLADIESVGDLLFAHNDPASEIHFYDMQPLENFVDNEPLEVTPRDAEIKQWDNTDSTRRLPPAHATSPILPLPDEVQEDPTKQPGSQSPAWIGTFDPNKSPQATQSPRTWAPATNTLQNNICYITIDDAPKPADLLELGLQEQEQTVRYNKELDLEDRIAVTLLAKMAPELEEKYGLDTLYHPLPPEDQGTVDNALADVSFDDNEKSSISDAFESCVKQHAKDQDANAFKKIIWKSITQPTALSACAKQVMCHHIGDDSGRGLFSIEFCKVPTRGYAVNAQQPIDAIEEVIDEMSNVCTSLKESGQLIEHNKTKDTRDHQLMRVDFSEKVSFGLSIGFKPTTDEVDPATVKREQVERNAFFERTLLDIGNPLTSLEERNKYVTLYDALWQQAKYQPDNEQVEQDKIELYRKQLQADTSHQKDSEVQLMHRATLLDEMQGFVEENTNFRRVANDYTHSLNQKWQATFERFKNDPGT